MTNPFGPAPSTTYVCVRTRRTGQLIELVHQVTNQKHPRYGAWVYRNISAGQRRRTGIITADELERNWEWVQGL